MCSKSFVCSTHIKVGQTQCDLMSRFLCSIFGHLQHWKFAQLHNNFFNVGSKFVRKLNKPANKCQRQRGENLPSLVTLAAAKLDLLRSGRVGGHDDPICLCWLYFGKTLRRLRAVWPDWAIFLHFGLPFKAGGNNYFALIAHLVRQLL